MNDTNSIVIIGRLTADAELTFISSGTALSKFSIANNRYAGKGKKDEVNFFGCVLWGKMAENLTTYLKKGKMIAVCGAIVQNRWTDSDGKNRSKIVINAKSIQLLGEGNNKQRESNNYY